MKRSAALLQLSREHHGALVLAMRARRINLADKPAVLRFMAEAAATFARELEPHFRIEETTLLPALTRAGETALVERTLAEHEELRWLAQQLQAQDAAHITRFGAALEAHVRFEERELFALAETLLKL